MITGFGAAKSYASFLLSFLIEYPILEKAQAAGEARLRTYFHGLNMKRKADKLAKLIMNAKPLTTDAVTLRCNSKRAVMIAEQLRVLSKHIRSYEAAIKELLPKYPQYAVAASLPGVAANTQARIIAAMGDREGRYASAQSLRIIAWLPVRCRYVRYPKLSHLNVLICFDIVNNRIPIPLELAFVIQHGELVEVRSRNTIQTVNHL